MVVVGVVVTVVGTVVVVVVDVVGVVGGCVNPEHKRVSSLPLLCACFK